MPNCCVCQFNVRNPKNIHSETIGNPPVIISDLLLRCTRGTDFEIPERTSICKKCCEKLLRYHKSVEVAKQVRQEILELIRSPIIIEEFKASLNRGELKVEGDGTSDTEFLIEVQKVVDGEDKEIELEELKEEYQIIDLEDLENDIVIEEFENEEEKLKLDNNTELSYQEEHLAESEPDVEEDCFDQEQKTDVELNRTISGEIKCPDCEKTFLTKRKYNTHMKREHFPGYVCDQCGKTLHSYSGFIGHLQNHDSVKQFECPECGERFRRKFRLKHHMAWHTGETPFQCDVCAKRFVHKVALHKHKMIHDDNTKRLECQVCEFKFRTKAHLDRHMRSHTGAKPFSCPVCKKQFSQMYNMKAHLREHENPGCNRQRRFRCNKCCHTFINEQHYQDHCQRDDCMSKQLTD